MCIWVIRVCNDSHLIENEYLNMQRICKSVGPNTHCTEHAYMCIQGDDTGRKQMTKNEKKKTHR